MPPGYLPLGKNIPMVSILRVLKRSFRDPVRPPGQCARRRQGLFLGLSDCPQPMPGSLPNPEEIVDSFHGDGIAVNALKNEVEADKILQWLKQEINQAWENLKKIKPSYESLSKPLILEVLKLLPRTNCRQGGSRPAWYLQFWLPTPPKALKTASSCRTPKEPVWENISPDSALSCKSTSGKNL